MVLLVLVLDEGLAGLEVRLDHLLDQGVEVDLALPAENALCLRGVAVEEAVEQGHASVLGQAERIARVERKRHALDFCRTEVLGVDLDDNLARFAVDALLVHAFTPPSIRSGEE